MKKKKLLIIIPIIILILLLIGVGGFAILYLKTDMFKSPKELFFKYAGNSFEATKDFDYDEFLEEYKTISEKSFKSTGEITASVKTDIDSVKQTADIINKAKINYTLNSIPKDEKSYFSLISNYDSKEVTRFEGLVNSNTFGLKNTDLYDKYIYIENDNLKKLARKFGINSNNVPDKIKKVDIYNLLYVDKNTRKKIKDTYYDVLDKKLDKKNFSQSKDIETTINGETLKTNSYSLELTQAETYDILVSLLETLKNDDTTLDLIVDKADKSIIAEYIQQTTNSSLNLLNSTSNLTPVTFDKEFMKNAIQQNIDNLNESKKYAKDENKIKFTIYSYKGKTVKINIDVITSDELETSTVEITKNKNGNNIISIHANNHNIAKLEYIKSTENNTEKLIGTLELISDIDDNNAKLIPINFNIESSNTLRKINIKCTLPADTTLVTYEKYFTEDALIEYNSETTGELGNGTNKNNSYLSITSGKTSASLNFTSDINYTDNINIADLTSNNGSCLNTMSLSEIENVLRNVVVNYRKKLPNKLKIIGIDLSLFGSSEDYENTENEENSQNSEESQDLEETESLAVDETIED